VIFSIFYSRGRNVVVTVAFVSSIFAGVELSHLLMQFTDVGLNIDVTGDVKVCVAKNF